jgi:hypothetical protein
MNIIFGGATAAVALATPALALEVKWGGDFNHRFMYSTQADLATNRSPEGFSDAGNFINETSLPVTIDTKKNSEDSDFLGELKYRLTLNATDDDKKVKGVLGFEFGAIKFGQTGASGAPFDGDQKQTLELRWAYTEFEVPFDTASKLNLGLMPVGYNKFLWSDNAAGVKWVSKRDNLSYSLGWFRDDVSNSGTGTSLKLENDDVYALDVTYAIPDGPKLNAFGLYYELGQQDLAAIAGDDDSMDKRYYLGLAGEGQAGALFYGFTGIYLGGEVVSGGGNFASGDDSLDREAWLGNVEATYKLEKTRIKAGWLYSTGDDDPTDDNVDNFINIDAYMGGFGSVVIFDSMADDNTLIPTPYIRSAGLNMPYVSVDHDLNDKASIGASALYILTAEEFDGADVDDDENDDIGIEIAARASYKITKNLSSGIEVGYLIGGDAWDELASDGDGDDVIRTDASIRYQF